MRVVFISFGAAFIVLADAAASKNVLIGAVADQATLLRRETAETKGGGGEGNGATPACPAEKGAQLLNGTCCPGNDIDNNGYKVTEEECGTKCWADSKCIGYTFRFSVGCFLKTSMDITCAAGPCNSCRDGRNVESEGEDEGAGGGSFMLGTNNSCPVGKPVDENHCEAAVKALGGNYNGVLKDGNKKDRPKGCYTHIWPGGKKIDNAYWNPDQTGKANDNYKAICSSIYSLGENGQCSNGAPVSKAKCEAAVKELGGNYNGDLKDGNKKDRPKGCYTHIWPNGKKIDNAYWNPDPTGKANKDYRAICGGASSAPPPPPAPPSYKNTVGYCRGGTSKWTAGSFKGLLWKCLPQDTNRNFAFTNEACAKECSKDKQCAAYDRQDGDKSECCLFLKGNKGDGRPGRSCYIKQGGSSLFARWLDGLDDTNTNPDVSADDSSDTSSDESS